MPKELPLKVTVDLEALKKTRDEVKKLEEELQLRKAPGRLKAVQDEIANLEKGAEKAGMTIGKAFGAGIASVAASFTALRLKAFFSEASESASRLEQAMSGLSSVAKAFKQDVGQVKSAAMSLSRDGFMTLEESATSLKNLMTAGMTAGKAKEFLEAAKNVSAFGNTVGSAGLAIQNFTKGVLSGNGQQIEDLSEEMKSVNHHYQEMIGKVGKAAANQYLFAQTLKLSNRYAGDANKYLETYQGRVQQMTAVQERLNQQIGKQVQELMTPLIGFWVNGLKGASEFFSGLSGGGQKLVLVLTTLGAVLISIIPALKLFWASALGPVGLLLAAIPIIAAFGLALTEAFNDKTRGQALLDEQKSLSDLVDQLKKTTGSAKELAEAQAKLVDVTKKLNDEYGPYLKNLGAENLAYALKLKTLKDIDKAIKDSGGLEELKGMSESALAAEIGKVKGEIKAAEKGGVKGTLFGSTVTLPTAEKTESVYDLKTKLGVLEAELKLKKKGTGGGGGGVGPALIDFRFIEARDALWKLTDEFDKYIKREKDAAKIQEANLKLATLRKQMISDLTAEVAGYNEEVTLQETAAEGSKFSKQIAAIERLRELELESINRTAKTQDEKTRETERVKTQHRQARENAEKQHELNMARIRIKGATDTMSALTAMAGGFSAMRNAKDTGGSVSGLGAALGGVGGLSSTFAKGGMFSNQTLSMLTGGIGAVAPMIGVAGGLISGLTSLFGKSDAERASEAERAEQQRAEQMKILELQASYQKAQLAIAEANAKLPFENLQRNLRLIDIQAQQKVLQGGTKTEVEAERLRLRNEAMTGVIGEQAGAISTGSLFSGQQVDPISLTQFLNKRASEKVAVETIVGIMNSATGGSLQELQTAMSQVGSLAGKVPDEIYATAEAALSNAIALRAAKDQFSNMQYVEGMVDGRWVGGRFTYENTGGSATVAGRSLSGSFEAMDWQALGAMQSEIVGGRAAISQLSSEFFMDVGTAENMISLLEQQQATQIEINENTKNTAENTGKLLQMPKAEQATFVDIGRGFTQSLGMLNAPVNAQNVTLPSALSSVMLATQTGAGNDDPVLSRLDAQLGVQRAMLGTLATIAAILDGDSSTDANATRDTIKAILADVKYRTLAA